VEMAGAGLATAVSTNAVAMPARQNAKRIEHSPRTPRLYFDPTSPPAITLY
jgi:hypothetical protein